VDRLPQRRPLGRPVGHGRASLRSGARACPRIRRGHHGARGGRPSCVP
jgi:hypothetical protein